MFSTTLPARSAPTSAALTVAGDGLEQLLVVGRQRVLRLEGLDQDEQHQQGHGAQSEAHDGAGTEGRVEGVAPAASTLLHGRDRGTGVRVDGHHHAHVAGGHGREAADGEGRGVQRAEEPVELLAVLVYERREHEHDGAEDDDEGEAQGVLGQQEGAGALLDGAEDLEQAVGRLVAHLGRQQRVAITAARDLDLGHFPEEAYASKASAMVELGRSKIENAWIERVASGGGNQRPAASKIFSLVLSMRHTYSSWLHFLLRLILRAPSLQRFDPNIWVALDTQGPIWEYMANCRLQLEAKQTACLTGREAERPDPMAARAVEPLDSSVVARSGAAPRIVTRAAQVQVPAPISSLLRAELPPSSRAPVRFGPDTIAMFEIRFAGFACLLTTTLNFSGWPGLLTALLLMPQHQQSRDAEGHGRSPCSAVFAVSQQSDVKRCSR
ncbi:hypothetical protein ON010_g8875 [Phytophthora cinnamomi]|nr:hypothetical protein ON010_g8875 [Phytophthora cinnamomi]